MSIENQQNQKGVRKVLVGAYDIAAADATVDFIMPQEFDRIMVKLLAVAPTADAALYLRMKLQGASAFESGASDYAWGYNSVLAGTGAVVASDAADAQIQLALQVGAAANENATGTIVIEDYYAQNGSDALPRAFWDLNVVNGTPGYVHYNGSGLYIDAAAKMVEAQLVFNGTTFAGGRVEVYGEYVGE